MKYPIIVLFLFLNTSCSDTLEDPGYPYQAEVLNLIPDSSIDYGPPKFQISTQKFKYLKNIKDLDGDFLKILFGVKLKIKSIDGSLVQLASQSKSQAPRLRYRVENGIVVPRDYNTLMTLSAYYLFEKIYDDLKNFTEIDQNQFSQWSGKINVFYEPTAVFEEDSSNITEVGKFNAAYDSENKSFLLFLRSKIENIPIAGNLQVLAHEFGHAIFDYIFFNSSPGNNEFFENSYTFHGINEGFADFISFIVTSSADILRASIDFEKFANQRFFSSAPFMYNTMNESCILGFYCIGTVFAKSLFNSMKTSNIDPKNQANRYNFSKKIIKSLGKSLNILKSDFNNFGLRKDTRRIKMNESNEDGWMGLFLRSMILGLDNPQDKKIFCDEFSSHFSEKGFATTFKEGVCSP